ncbi:MAG: hypothetical protein FWB96_05560 [Defluviitaleaceae bacterium]|nr:hypothetical protein [Defluviitaleaceae bacterium]MCL2262254.1 hypothetical protein [Defluviitaleaceae bacterium]
MIRPSIRFSIAFLVIALVWVVPAQARTVNGKINAEIIYQNDALSTPRRNLANLLRSASFILQTTGISPDGANLTRDEYWVTSHEHSTFRTAIQTAQTTYTENLPVLSYGDEFYLAISISENAGFAGMFFRLHLPQGLEITAMHLHEEDHPELSENFQGVRGWNGTDTVSPPQTNNAYAGWLRNDEFTHDGYLITYTIRVNQHAATGLTAPIKLSFGTAIPNALTTPIDRHNNPITIALPGGWTVDGAIAEIGQIRVY